MKERPILFSSPMVKALLAGTKTQTRRLVKPQPGPELGETPGAAWNAGFVDVKCPYGQEGDRLWVREAWGFDSGVRGDFRPLGRNDLSGMDLLTHTLYRADGGKAPRWRPSIHMPRWASRITLEVTSVRVERLQDITEEDAKAEGVDSVPVADVPRNGTLYHRDDFAQLWDIINGSKAPWSSNPWVWVVGFRRLP